MLAGDSLHPGYLQGIPSKIPLELGRAGDFRLRNGHYAIEFPAAPCRDMLKGLQGISDAVEKSTRQRQAAPVPSSKSRLTMRTFDDHRNQTVDKKICFRASENERTAVDHTILASHFHVRQELHHAVDLVVVQPLWKLFHFHQKLGQPRGLGWQ